MIQNDIHLLDLISRDKLEEILYHFTQATGVASIITEINGEPITTPQNFTSLCSKFCRSTVEGVKRCHDSDSYGGQESARQRKFVIYKCLNAGLLDSAFPIVIDDMHLANVLMGQVLEKPMEKSVAIQKATEIGVEDIDGYLNELQSVPIVDRDQLKKIAGLMAVVTRTISELALQQYLSYRRSRRYLNKLVNSVSDGIIATDGNFLITKINEAGATMFGIDKLEIVGNSLSSLFIDPTAINAFHTIVDLGEEESARFELTAVDSDLRNFPVQLALSGIKSNSETEGFVAVVRDITEEKKVEKMKEDLVGMLTHDMGNPIISIQKALQILVDQILGELNVTQMEMLRLALGTGNQLLGLVSDFLDIYRSENGQFLLRKELLSMESVLMKSIEQVQLFAMEKKIGISFVPSEELKKFNGDRTRLLRTCVNLIDNAIKYSPESSKIEICIKKVMLNEEESIPTRILKRLRQDIPYCLVTITDYGAGIPEKYQKDVFDKFFRIKNEDGILKGRKGTGLGLSYCRLVVYAHNGYIWVVSPIKGWDDKHNKGCMFNFVLPLVD
ncbi:sensor histidine kinase [Desulfogranum marinum]|uniref:sensor histidine kinase n=1 Tax=Desulfogranum marinum TaxID=453220 RepID=UPI001966C2D0|nr:PocR ligand-binding domain-containing protein [Desulfogranum marinum]MBM9512634.1 PocR ligand-binding domain-containing protein [Desulfogranum marinum]